MTPEELFYGSKGRSRTTPTLSQTKTGAVLAAPVYHLIFDRVDWRLKPQPTLNITLRYVAEVDFRHILTRTDSDIMPVRIERLLQEITRHAIVARIDAAEFVVACA